MIAAALHRQRPLAKPETLLPGAAPRSLPPQHATGRHASATRRYAIPSFADATQMTLLPEENSRGSIGQLAKWRASQMAHIAWLPPSPWPSAANTKCSSVARTPPTVVPKLNDTGRGTRDRQSPPPANACSARIISGIGDFGSASRREICSTPGVPRLTPPDQTPAQPAVWYRDVRLTHPERNGCGADLAAPAVLPISPAPGACRHSVRPPAMRRHRRRPSCCAARGRAHTQAATGFTAIPRAMSCRAQWWAEPQASITTRPTIDCQTSARTGRRVRSLCVPPPATPNRQWRG